MEQQQQQRQQQRKKKKKKKKQKNKEERSPPCVYFKVVSLCTVHSSLFCVVCWQSRSLMFWLAFLHAVHKCDFISVYYCETYLRGRSLFKWTVRQYVHLYSPRVEETIHKRDKNNTHVYPQRYAHTK